MYLIEPKKLKIKWDFLKVTVFPQNLGNYQSILCPLQVLSQTRLSAPGPGFYRIFFVRHSAKTRHVFPKVENKIPTTLASLMWHWKPLQKPMLSSVVFSSSFQTETVAPTLLIGTHGKTQLTELQVGSWLSSTRELWRQHTKPDWLSSDCPIRFLPACSTPLSTEITDKVKNKSEPQRASLTGYSRPLEIRNVTCGDGHSQSEGRQEAVSV